MADSNDLIPIVVVGAHLSGLPLNGQLTDPCLLYTSDAADE